MLSVNAAGLKRDCDTAEALSVNWGQRPTAALARAVESEPAGDSPWADRREGNSRKDIGTLRTIWMRGL